MMAQVDSSTEASIDTDDGGIRVVCVDDEPGLAEAVSTALEHVDDDIRATATTCPMDALELVEEEALDCVVSDYDMPGRDGAWLCERVEEHDVPFVLYTSHSELSIDLDDPQLRGVSTVVRKDRGMAHYADLAEHIRRAIAVETSL